MIVLWAILAFACGIAVIVALADDGFHPISQLRRIQRWVGRKRRAVVCRILGHSKLDPDFQKRWICKRCLRVFKGKKQVHYSSTVEKE